MAYTIDPANKRIVLDSATVTAKSIYVAWVNWAATADNAKYLPAFRSVGGDDLGGGLFIPPYYFLANGWKVRPMEADQTLTITGNLFVDGGGDPVVKTLGTFNVLTKLVVPVQAQGISTTGSTGPSATEIAQAVMAQIQASSGIPANIVQVNSVPVTGNGQDGTEWGPAA
jgi:hypothetical protein